ncbi:MAG TPA: hypothetical protein ENH85_13185 [Candidatus Scalindua sp.]|nr:hypothetical protein [Candidatus Scalindua sp.]
MKKEFVYITSGAKTLRIYLLKTTSSILWKRNGLFSLIPFSRIQNALDNWNDLHGDSELIPEGIFHWRETIHITPKVANALLGEDKDDKCVYKDKNEN